jgi:hypothetical protein
MKTVAKVVEVDGEGLVALLDKMVLIICNNYFYYGKLAGVNDTCIKLEQPYKVFETGAYGEKKFADAQKLPVDAWYIQTAHIESFGESFKSV